MNKIIAIDSNMYLLPEGMTAKDVQSLAGFLVTLTRVDSRYCYNGKSVYYPGAGAAVSLVERALVTEAEADRISDEARKAYEAKQAEKAAEA